MKFDLIDIVMAFIFAAGAFLILPDAKAHDNDNCVSVYTCDENGKNCRWELVCMMGDRR